MKKTFPIHFVLMLLVGFVVFSAHAASVIVNGDFEGGNSGFSTDYEYDWDLNPEGRYCVSDNPHNHHPDFVSMGDHTSGSGLMMICNGSPNTNEIVWRGTISTDLHVGRQYDFSAWLTNVTGGNPAILTFLVDGVEIATLSPSGVGSWQRLFGTFTAMQARPTFTLKNAQGAMGGNDFAIDDINVFVAGTQNPPNTPDIQIERPVGTYLPNPSDDPVGDLTVGLLYDLIYTIRNTSEGTLDVTSANAFNLHNVDSYTVVTPLPLSINEYSQATLTVRFRVPNAGPFDFDIDFISNDPDEGNYSVDPYGQGLAADINVQRPEGHDLPNPSDDNVGHLLIGCGRTLTYTIQNTGSGLLQVTSANAFNLHNVSGYSVVTPLPLQVAPYSSGTLTVSFCLEAIGPFDFDIDIISNDPDEGNYSVDPYGTAWPPAQAIFYATPTMGCLECVISFENHSQGMTNAWQWDFGDKQTSTEENPVHVYRAPGQYDVTLIASNPADSDTLVYKQFIWVYGYGAINWAPLALVDNSFSFPEESWENAIDGDVSGWRGTATVEGTPPYVVDGNPPFAIFKFADNTVKTINAVRMLTDTNIGNDLRWVGHFRVMVSTTGTAEGDFVTVLNAMKNGGQWQQFNFPAVQAKYIKLVIDTPKSGWRQIGEFQVCPAYKLPSPPRCTMVATTPHIADGADQSIITMTIRDANGELLSGFTNEDFCIWATPEPNLYFPVVETANPGVYVTQLATLYGGPKTFGASVIGIPIGTVPILFNQPALGKAALAFVQGSQTSKNEEWDNAIDGDLTGWDGTVTATGTQCYGIFQFADGAVKTLQRLAMLLDTGVGHQERWASRFRLLVSTTGLNDADFTLAYDGWQNRGDWQSHMFPAVKAKYIKLIVDFPRTGWRQIGEIEAFVAMVPAASQEMMQEENLAQPKIAKEFAVSKIYPNPFNPVTQMEFSLPKEGNVSVTIYNMRGQKVRTLLDGYLNAGLHTLVWNGADDNGQPLPSGTYFFRLQAGEQLHVQKVLMMK